MIYFQLFWEFFKAGLFAVGGGMATIPFLYDISDKTGWFTHQDLSTIIAVGESTPGPIGVNMATYVGYISGMAQNGSFGALFGAVIATLGLVTPSVIIILIVAKMLKSFKDNKYVKAAFYGLRPASVGLIAAAGISVVFSCLFVDEQVGIAFLNLKGIVLGIILWLLSNKIKISKNLHPIYFIIGSALVGIIFKM